MVQRPTDEALDEEPQQATRRDARYPGLAATVAAVRAPPGVAAWRASLWRGLAGTGREGLHDGPEDFVQMICRAVLERRAPNGRCQTGSQSGLFVREACDEDGVAAASSAAALQCRRRGGGSASFWNLRRQAFDGHSSTPPSADDRPATLRGRPVRKRARTSQDDRGAAVREWVCLLLRAREGEMSHAARAGRAKSRAEYNMLPCRLQTETDSLSFYLHCTAPAPAPARPTTAGALLLGASALARCPDDDVTEAPTAPTTAPTTQQRQSTAARCTTAPPGPAAAAASPAVTRCAPR
ncbi:hypothetical protein EJ04DRAFT_587893 [Polyplosphaeria fusca]|uniref:Uncharacterized protein n=1 Tax=Polyplosphaeria fusca TaxID=682080 RepID=A0A9P4QNJ5_9PLEO|nr:hypothetical protein EJ04DRAFT_587893 [Polyplosphaeria fusca]